MGLSVCNIITDLHDQELSKHGNQAFPIACYNDDLNVSEVSWHWHEEWEIVLVTEGCLKFDLENSHERISQGDGVFINSRVLHAVQNGSPDSGKLHSAVFHPRLVGGSVDSIFWQDLVQPFLANEATRFLILKQDIPWQRDVLRWFHEAWAAIEEERDDYENFSRYQLSRVMREIVRNTDFSQSNLSGQELIRVQRIRSMMEYIEMNYMEDLTVDRIAGSISVSNSACLRCFHEMLNTTPMQYVIETRLKKAAGMLRTTNRSAKDIALACGFSDTSYFTKIFRLKYQCTPGNFRKMSGSGTGQKTDMSVIEKISQEE